MSTQSAQYRTVTTSPAAPVTFTDEAPQEDANGSRSEAVSVWWIPALMIGAWVELAYVVPVLADWFAKIS